MATKHTAPITGYHDKTRITDTVTATAHERAHWTRLQVTEHNCYSND